MSTDCLLSVGLKCLTCVTSFYPPSNMMKQGAISSLISQVAAEHWFAEITCPKALSHSKIPGEHPSCLISCSNFDTDPPCPEGGSDCQFVERRVSAWQTCEHLPGFSTGNPSDPRVWALYRRRLSSLNKDPVSGPHSAAGWGLSRVGQGQGREGLREATKAGLLHPGWLDHPSIHSSVGVCACLMQGVKSYKWVRTG